MNMHKAKQKKEKVVLPKSVYILFVCTIIINTFITYFIISYPVRIFGDL